MTDQEKEAAKQREHVAGQLERLARMYRGHPKMREDTPETMRTIALGLIRELVQDWVR